jgi:hypothetical protein
MAKPSVLSTPHPALPTTSSSAAADVRINRMRGP